MDHIWCLIPEITDDLFGGPNETDYVQILQGGPHQVGSVKSISHAEWTIPSFWYIICDIRYYFYYMYIYEHMNHYINVLGFFVRNLGGNYRYHSNINAHNFTN